MSDDGKDPAAGAPEPDSTLSEFLGLVVHDLRNPLATISANVSFVRDVAEGDGELGEALDDVEMAVEDLMRGLEQMSWIGQWIGGLAPHEGSDGDLMTTLRSAVDRVGVGTLEGPERLSVRCAGHGLTRLMELLLANSKAHAAADSIRISVRAQGAEARVEIRDGGRALAPELRKLAFTMAGQKALKARADGRYSRVTGLLAARALSDGLGARLEAGGEDGQAMLVVCLPLTSP